MPIEIRELVVKATVSEDGGGGSQGNATATGAEGSATEQTINMCVERILEILKEKNER